MCGFAIWYSDSENLRDKQNVLENMSSTLCRRGPDEKGIYLKENICLLHRRLTVIDPETGKQPMTESPGGSDL